MWELRNRNQLHTGSEFDPEALFCQSRNSGATISPLICQVLRRGLCITALLPWGVAKLHSGSRQDVTEVWYEAGECISSRVLHHGWDSGCQKHVKLLITTKSVECMTWALERNLGWRHRVESPPYRWCSLKDMTFYQKLWREMVVSFIITKEMRSALC